MSKIVIDGRELDVPAEYTLLQACEAAGAEIPRFCFHERLSIAGNCRMCLVEVKGGPPKPTASCAMAVKDLRPGPNGEPPVVMTNSPMARKARKGVMEFLLINHPLDCPICDQGGECDLQDQAMAYGADSSRFSENKRAVEDKYIGALVKTSMNRCIQCTRCVRFVTEVAGVPELGAIGRGEDMEITSYLEQALSSGAAGERRRSLSGWRFDLETDCVSRSSVGIRQDRVDRCDGRAWLGDPGRFARPRGCAHFASRQRRDQRGMDLRQDETYRRRTKGAATRSSLHACRWSAQARKLGGSFRGGRRKVAAALASRIGAIVGDLATVEEMFALKSLLAKLGSPNIDCRQDGSKLHPKFGRASYLFNSTIAGVDQADALLVVGSNPRHEAPILNARIRKRWLRGGVPIGVVGPKADLTYGSKQLGVGPETLAQAWDKPPEGAAKPIMIVGAGAFARPDGVAILASLAKAAHTGGVVKDGWNGFSVLHNAASRVGGLDLGLVPGDGGLDAVSMAKANALDVLFNLGADEIDIEPGAFVVYVGTHGDRGAHRADVILPGAAYTEKTGIYVNTEGRPQFADRAVFPPGDAREDWSILRALSEPIGAKLPFDSLSQLRAALAVAYPFLVRFDAIEPADASVFGSIAALGGLVDKAPFVPPISDFYFTNPIARASRVMAECSALARGVQREAAE